MHTAICSFEHRELAEQARDRLLQAGFARRDVHLQQRGPTNSDSMGEDPRAWEGTDHEVAASRDMVDKVAGFFVHMFGADRNREHNEVYEKAVERGHTVLVVDSDDPSDVQRARSLLHDLQAADLNVYDRSDGRPMREWTDRPLPGSSGGVHGSYQDRSSAFDDRPDPVREHAVPESSGTLETSLLGGMRRDDSPSPGAEADRERAVAKDTAVAPSAGRDWSASPGADADRDRSRAGGSGAGDDDAVGLRYADKDQPGR